MRGPDVFGQVGAAGEQQLAVIPAARGAQRLAAAAGRRRAARRRRAVTVEHGRRGAAAGRRALHVHQSAADTEENTHTHYDKFLTKMSTCRHIKDGTDPE